MISVIIPTFNRGHYLPDAVDSVLAQTYQDFEIIVVDDGSSDNTKGLMIDYMRRYPARIKYFYQNNNGSSAARNVGIKAASGELLAFLDSDDIWLSSNLELLYKALIANEYAGLATSTVQMIDANSRPLSIKPEMKFGNTVEDKLYNMSHIAPSSVLIRKDVFARVGMFDESVRAAEDIDMWLRISVHYSVVRIDRPLALCRVHGNNLSSNQKQIAIGHLSYWKKILNDRKTFGWVPLNFLRKKIARYHYLLGRHLLEHGEYRGSLKNIFQSLGYYPLAGKVFFESHDTYAKKVKKILNPYLALSCCVFKLLIKKYEDCYRCA